MACPNNCDKNKRSLKYLLLCITKKQYFVNIDSCSYIDCLKQIDALFFAFFIYVKLKHWNRSLSEKYTFHEMESSNCHFTKWAFLLSKTFISLTGKLETFASWNKIFQSWKNNQTIFWHWQNVTSATNS